MDRNIMYFGLVAIVLAALPFVTANEATIEAVAISNPKIEAKQMYRMPLRAIGTGITSDGSDYHVFGIIAREIRVPTTDVESITTRVIGAMKFGEEKYWIAGERTDNNYVFRVFSKGDDRSCLIKEDLDSCGTTLGSLELTRLDNYENVPHFVVGNLEISERDYLVTGRGWKRALQTKSVEPKRMSNSKAVKTTQEVNAVVSETA